MTAGSHTEDILHDKICSHSLSTTLKVYLPFLKLNKNEWVVVDEKAGADAVTTGIPSGFDYAVIVVEPRPQSIAVAKNIAKLLSFYETPVRYLGNKINTPQEKNEIENEINAKLSACIPFHSEFHPELLNDLSSLLDTFTQEPSPLTRKERSLLKVKRNKEYSNY
ncbi:MAG: hypothetical protein WDZ88_03700 [Candidatus Paceibacterota bacterium]